MRRTALVLLTIALLSGCSSRDNAFRYFQKLDGDKERAVLNMRRISLKEGNRTESMLVAVYLNAVYPELYHDQNSFVVSLYDVDNRPLERFSLSLNDAAPVAAVELEQNCTLRRLMPIDNPWGKSYQVIFPGSRDTNLTLRFGSGPSLQGQATFYTDR